MYDTVIAPNFVDPQPLQYFPAETFPWIHPIHWLRSHFAVGGARSFFTGRSVFRSGIDMFVVGLGVAAVGYFVGDLVAKLL